MTEWLSRFALHEPLWLLLLPLPWLALRARRASGRGRMAGFADPHLLRWLIVESGGARNARLVRLAWLLIILALSGPELHTGEVGPERPGADLAVVIDISPSMLTADLETDRLRRARLELRDFITRLGNDRTALVVYSAYAYTLLPLTHDHDLLRHYAEDLTPTLTRRRGSNLVQGLELASQTLGTETRRGRAIVLLSDGETDGHEAVLAAADRLRQRHIPVYALGLGTPTGGPIPATGGGYLRHDGEVVTSRLDRDLLQALAARSGGRYADARRDDGDWDLLMAGLDRLARTGRPGRDGGQVLALYPWVFAAGLALLLWNAAGWRASARALAPAMMIFALVPGDGAASPWREQAAHEALTEGRYAEAARLYGDVSSFAGALGRGAAAYRMGEWAAALDAFVEAERRATDSAQRADAEYNRGNTLIRMGRLEDAARTFERVLRIQPGHKAAGVNLALLNRALAQPRHRADAKPQRPGAQENDNRHDGLGGEAPGDGPARNAALLRAVQRWTEGAGNAPVTSGPRESSAAILRQRFMVQDAEHPLTRDSRPW